MQGFLADKNGTQYSLPELLSWDVCHAMGEACDYFEVTTLFDSTMLPQLQSAVRFIGKNGNSTVFCGVVDEYVVSINEKGATVSINGRSLAALLMDNEVQKVTYFAMTKASALEHFVTPYGISNVASCNLPQVLMFQVKSGDSAWTALKRYCLKAGHCAPRFSASGTLLLAETSGNTVTINADNRASAIKYKDERYGIISRITVTNRSSGGSYTLNNQAFINRGGSCRRYLYTDKFEQVVSNPSQADDTFTGEYQIQQSKYGKNVIEITVAEQFACFPGDTAVFSSTAVGITKNCKVIKTHCWADALSAGTIITVEA